MLFVQQYSQAQPTRKTHDGNMATPKRPLSGRRRLL
jgi:hypothetical protein